MVNRHGVVNGSPQRPITGQPIRMLLGHPVAPILPLALMILSSLCGKHSRFRSILPVMPATLPLASAYVVWGQV